MIKMKANISPGTSSYLVPHPAETSRDTALLEQNQVMAHLQKPL